MDILACCELFKYCAEGSGHTVEFIDVVPANIYPGTGCIYCGYDDICVLKDDIEKALKFLALI